MEPLKKAYGEDLFSQLELVEADLLNEESLIAACEGCTYIVHTASPFPLTPPKNEDELIKPAVEGTLAALKGAEKFGVKRVVITSSLAAVYAISPSLKKTQYSEHDWSDPKVAKAYDKSKTLAEKAAWDFVKALPDDKKIELATINPGWVLGPNLVTCSFSSGDGIKQFMDGSLPSYPLIKMPLVDVRDVAEAHLQAILKPEAAGRRFFMASESMWMGDMCKILTDKWGKQYKIPQKQASKCMMTILSWFITDIKIIMP
jgi:dihydroflavonol-4-reductase